MTEPRDPYGNPPGWTDPYADLPDMSGGAPAPQPADQGPPPTTPPGSPLLTGLVVGLLLVALSVAVFQLLKSDDTTTTATETTTTTDTDPTVTTVPGESTTTTAGDTTPPSKPYPPVGSEIPVDKMRLMADRVGILINDVPDLKFGDPADISVGRLTASFGDPDEDTGWQVSTGQWGVCTGDLERVVRFGPFAAILTTDGTNELFSGYRQDVSFGDLDSPAMQLTTRSGFKAGETVERLKQVYAQQDVKLSVHPTIGDIFELRESDSGTLLLWGPIQGTDPDSLVIGIFAPDVCPQS